MVRTIGMAAATTTTVTRSPPRLVMIGGITGVGKSTLASSLAHESGIHRIVSTDAIREVMRTMSDDSALHRSSFSKGETGDAVLDWEDTCKAVESGVQATIDRSRREGIDLILEGVHLIPDSRLIDRWRESGGIAIGVLLVVNDLDKHADRIREREATSFRPAERYIAAQSRMMDIQQVMSDKATVSRWHLVEEDELSSTLKRVRHHMDVAWNEHMMG